MLSDRALVAQVGQDRVGWSVHSVSSGSTGGWGRSAVVSCSRPGRTPEVHTVRRALRWLSALRGMVATEQAVVASGGQADPGLASVQAEVTAKQTAYDQALGSYQDLLAKAQSELN